MLSAAMMQGIETNGSAGISAHDADAPGVSTRSGRSASLETVVRTALPVRLRLTLGPTFRAAGGRGGRLAWVAPDGGWWRAVRTPEGAATVRFCAERHGVHVRAWGPGAEWLLGAAPGWLGARDSLEGFEPKGVVLDLHRRMPGLRIGRSGLVFDTIVPTVLAQKVTGREAGRSWGSLVRTLARPAPGPGAAGLVLPPPAEALAALPYQDYHPHGVEMRRANVIRGLAAGAARLERAADLPLPKAYPLLRSFPGVGAWTAAEVAGPALGDADAVSVGDYHIPNTVSWALAGEPRGTDERMLELLAPYEGHRGRVIRLLEAAGLTAPRFGPRAPIRSIRRL
jgi:3-methyladenine DNA glycosylase/8-oxoguanine DNA glycosylase